MTRDYCSSCSGCAACPRPRLLPQNQLAVKAFDAVSTQWRTSGMGQRTGLDYAGVESALRLRFPRASAARRRRLFADVRTVEAALLRAWRDVAAAKAGAG